MWECLISFQRRTAPRKAVDERKRKSPHPSRPRTHARLGSLQLGRTESPARFRLDSSKQAGNNNAAAAAAAHTWANPPPAAAQEIKLLPDERPCPTEWRSGPGISGPWRRGQGRRRNRNRNLILSSDPEWSIVKMWSSLALVLVLVTAPALADLQLVIKVRQKMCEYLSNKSVFGWSSLTSSPTTTRRAPLPPRPSTGGWPRSPSTWQSTPSTPSTRSQWWFPVYIAWSWEVLIVFILQSYSCDIFFNQQWSDNRLKLPSNLTHEYKWGKVNTP